MGGRQDARKGVLPLPQQEQVGRALTLDFGIIEEEDFGGIEEEDNKGIEDI